VVTNTADPGDGTCDDAGTGDGCTLREAITFAGPGANITFDAGVTGTITLTAGELVINKPLTITGPGARSLAVSGNDAGRVFDVNSGVGPVALAGLTVTGGGVVGSVGGGIASSGTLTLTRCTVTGNRAVDGGGIYNEGTLTVVQSTVSGNRASQYGGGIFSETNSDLSASSATILNSTVSGNTADAGGGVTNYNGLTRVLQSTITANQAPSGGGLWSFGDGVTRTDIAGSIVAGNTADGNTPNDVANNQTTTRYRSLGYNLVGAAGANVDFTLELNQTGDRTGVTDPAVLKLGALADNGGPTDTHGILTGSAAFDTGDPAFDPSTFTPPLATDQRGTGFARVSGGRIDVGAFERQVTLFPFTGFFQPVDNPGTNDDVVNRAKAGAAIPVKFTLGGNQWLAIFRSGYPKFVSAPCDASDVQDDIEATTANPAGLTYDAAIQQYTYVWKTDKSWAGRCGALELGLTDGSDHHALFRFVR
jgi:CSLREA domain-containing protein